MILNFKKDQAKLLYPNSIHVCDQCKFVAKVGYNFIICNNQYHDDHCFNPNYPILISMGSHEREGWINANENAITMFLNIDEGSSRSQQYRKAFQIAQSKGLV